MTNPPLYIDMRIIAEIHAQYSGLPNAPLLRGIGIKAYKQAKRPGRG